MTNEQRSNVFAKALVLNTPFSRRARPRNNSRKTEPPHGALSYSHTRSINGAHNAHRQSHHPVLPVPPNAPPLLDSLLQKAGSAVMTETLSRPSNWSRDWNARQKPMLKGSTVPPYESVSSAWNSRRSLKNAAGGLTPLSTSSKVNTTNLSMESSKVNNVHISKPSKNYSPKYVANAQESTHRPSQLHRKSPPRKPRKQGVRPQNTSVSPSSPKGKRSPTLTAKRRISHPPPPLSLERPTSPQEPSLNPQQWKSQIRVSTKHDVAPEHASRPTEPAFPLVHQPPHGNISPSLRKQHHVDVPLSSRGHSGKVVDQINPLVNIRTTGVKRALQDPPQGEQHVVSVENPGLDFSSEDDKPLAQVFGPFATPRAKNSLKRPTVNVARQPDAGALVTKRQPIPPREKIPSNQTLKCKAGAAKPPTTDTLEVVESTNLQNVQEKGQRNPVPHVQSPRAVIPPPKKRRVVGNEDDPKLRVSSDAPTDGTHAPASLDLTQIEKSRRLKFSKKVGVSPISITEAPFEVSFEDPAMAELRSLNGHNSMCLLGNSMKAAASGIPAAQRRRCLSFERKGQELCQPVYIADPHDQLMMQEALAAVNVKFEEHV